MTMNVFEGARRLTKLVIVLWSLGWALALFASDPFLFVKFRVDYPDEPTLAEGSQCDGDDFSYINTIRTTRGKKVSAEFCFIARPFGKEVLIPFAAKGDLVYGLGKRSQALTAYAHDLTNRFKPNAAVERQLEKDYWTKRLEDMTPVAVGAAVGVLALYLFTWCIGWIVRGFMGIPSGEDSRPQTPV